MQSDDALAAPNIENLSAPSGKNVTLQLVSSTTSARLSPTDRGTGPDWPFAKIGPKAAVIRIE